MHHIKVDEATDWGTMMMMIWLLAIIPFCIYLWQIWKHYRKYRRQGYNRRLSLFYGERDVG